MVTRLFQHIMGLLVIALASFAALADPQEIGFGGHLASGKEALQKSRYVDADRELNAAIQQAAKPENRAEALELLCDLDLLTGKYVEAVSLQERAVKELELSPDLRTHLHRLASAYRAAGRAADAELTLLRILGIDENGTDESKVWTDADALGSLYLYQRRYGEARRMYSLAFDLRARKLGGDHLDIASSYVSLGVVEEHDSKFVAARLDYDQALAVSEKLLGPDDYRLTGILDRLGFLLRNQKKYALAVPFFQRSLSIRERTLGPRHSEVAPALDNLALTYFGDAKLTDAEPLFLRSLQVWEATTGSLSPQVASALDNLGALYSAQQRTSEAETMYKKALWLREKSDIEVLSNLALLYASQKNTKQADAYFQRALLISEKGYGGEHEESVDLIEEYATFLDAASRPLEAKRLRLHQKELRGKLKP